MKRRDKNSRSSRKALGKPTRRAQSITTPPRRIAEGCPECDGLMRIVPAGISKKTSKSYPEFASCERHPHCQGTRRIPKPPPTT